MVKKVAKRIMITIGIFSLVIVAAGIYSQTQFFRNHLRSFAESEAESLLNADVTIGTIGGNLLTGFTIDTLAVSLDSLPLLELGRIEASYDLFGIPARVFRLQKVELTRPRVRLISNPAGEWNLDRMFRQSPADTTAVGGFDWTIILDNLTITDGAFYLTDSAALADSAHGPVRPGFIEYHQIALEGLQAEMAGEVGANRKEVLIRQFSVASGDPAFDLRHFSGAFTVTGTTAAVKDLTILTRGSSIVLDARMDEFDLLGGIDLFDLRTNPVEVALRNSDINLNELAMFIPDIDFLNGTVSADLDAGGTFGDIDVRRLDLVFGQTEFHVDGMVFNLHTPGDLHLDVRFRDSFLHTDDVRAVLSEFNLPDLHRLGLSAFDLDFRGTPLDFNTRISMRNNAGVAGAEIHLAIGGPPTLTYEATGTFNRFDLAPLFDNDSSSSSLNGTVSLVGSGIDLDYLNGRIDLAIDTSLFYGNRLQPSTARLHVADGNLEGTVKARLGSFQAMLDTRFERLLSDRPGFRITGDVISLDIAELAHDQEYRSDITMHLDATGEGITPATVSGEFNLEFLHSSYQQFDLDSGRVFLMIDQRDPNDRTIRVESDLADVLVRGSFDLAYLADLISFEQRNMTAALKEKFAVVDSTMLDGTERAGLSILAENLRARSFPLNTTFEIAIKDLEPISLVTGEKTFDGVGTLRGAISGDFHNLALSAELDATELFYGTVESGFYIKGGRIELDVENLEPVDDPFPSIRVEFLTEADVLHLSLDEFDSLGVSLRYQDGKAEYSAAGVYEADFGFLLNGDASVAEDLILFEPEIADIRLRKDHWVLGPDATLEFRSDGAVFRNLTFSKDSQEVRLEGNIGIDGRLEGVLTVDRFGLAALKDLLQSEEDRPGRALLDGTASVRVDASGTFPDPVFVASLEAHDVSLRGQPFGELLGTITYRDGLTAVDLSVTESGAEPGQAPRLRVGGAIPFRLPFSDSADPDPREVNLRIRSEGLQIAFLDPLLPTFDDLTGLLKCDLLVVGDPDSLVYEGSFSISESSFLFEPNNIQYRFHGDFEPVGDRIRIVRASAENIPSDNSPGRTGRIDFSGDFRFRDFVPSDFNIFANGELLLVKPESRSSPLPIYGDLYIETGSGGLHFTGTIQNSLLSGEVYVQRSRVIFPPTRTAGDRGSVYSIPIVVVDDTSRKRPVGQESFRDRYFLTDGDANGTVRPAQPSRSFLDGVSYNLSVATLGPSSEIRMIFSEIPAEELQANFQGRWIITGDGTRWVGDFDIDRAQYTFFKQFDATGSLRYTGEFLNPELNITARYQSTRSVLSTVDSTTRVERVVVLLKITGTRNKPEHEVSMTIDDLDYFTYTGPKSSDLESDAIAFILAGNFPLTRSESSSIATDIQTSVGASMMVGASSILTKELSEYLRRETGFITSVELGYEGQGSFAQSADIRLSGTAFKGYWRYRGTILDNPFSNANVSLLYSFGDIFENPSLRNFMFELERRAETGTSGVIDDRREVNSARLFYRFSF